MTTEHQYFSLRTRLAGAASTRGGFALLVGVVLLTMVASVTAWALPIRTVGDADTTDVADLGCGPGQVTKTLATGSAWRMCVRVDPIKGLVLEKVQFRPATGDREYSGWLPVIDSVYLAQLVVPYDDGSFVFNDVTGYGFGGGHLLDQNAQTCPGDTLPVQHSGMVGTEYNESSFPGICLDEVDTGLAWHAVGTQVVDGDRYSQQGRALEISSLTKISWYEYQQKVTLTDQGTITVGLGATGDLAPSLFGDDPAVGWPVGPEGDESSETHATSHRHDAIYRVDFGLGSGAQQVQRWDYTRPDAAGQPTLVEGAGTIQTEAFHADDDVDPQTWWRVLNPTSLNADGHARSYEIVNDSIQNPYDPLTRPKVSFTNDHACQEYASDNLNAGCPGQSVLDYVAGEGTTPLTDPVAWVNVGFHHIDRDEDQSPMPVHWQQFSLVPRDLLAQQATTPIERSCVNGGPFAPYGSCAAVNLSAPGITPDAGPVGTGTVLTSDIGIWRPARSTLTYQRIWLRDGEPIASIGPDGLPTNATGPLYVVTAADLGRRISVRVDATGTGVIPGSATSRDLLIPAASTPPVSEPPVAKPPRAPSRLKIIVPARGKPRLEIRVQGKLGAGSGKVVVRGPGGWKRTASLHRGRVTIRVSRSQLERSRRLVVRYAGDARYLPAQQQVRLRQPRR